MSRRWRSLIPPIPVFVGNSLGTFFSGGGVYRMYKNPKLVLRKQMCFSLLKLLMPQQHLSPTIITLVSVEWFSKYPPEERNGSTDATFLLHGLHCPTMNTRTMDVLPPPTFTKIESEQSQTGSSCYKATFSSGVIYQAGQTATDSPERCINLKEDVGSDKTETNGRLTS